MMKIYTLWSREGCDTDEAPWLLAATDEVSILENNGYPEAFQAAVTRHPAARLLILEVPAAALKLWHTPTVQVQPVSDLEQLATKLGIKEVSRAALEAEREALRQRFRTEFGLTTDEAISVFLQHGQYTCTHDLVDQWIETTALMGGEVHPRAP